MMNKREKMILNLLSQGMTIKEISREIHISERTVNEMLMRYRKKTGARNTIHAVALAIRAGLISIGSFAIVGILCWSSLVGSQDIIRTARMTRTVRTQSRSRRNDQLIEDSLDVITKEC